MVAIDPASHRRDDRPRFHRCATCVRQ